MNPTSISAPARCVKSIRDAAGADDLDILDATGLATALMGDSIATNLFMLGYAWQSGAIPLSLEAIYAGDRAERRRGRDEQARLRLGPPRRARSAARRSAARQDVRARRRSARTLDEIIAKRAEFLTAYQDEAYAERYRALVERVRAAEAKARRARSGLAEAVATLYKLMAYKDEYEVARLYTDGEFAKALTEQFEGDPAQVQPRAAAARAIATRRRAS